MMVRGGGMSISIATRIGSDRQPRLPTSAGVLSLVQTLQCAEYGDERGMRRFSA